MREADGRDDESRQWTGTAEKVRSQTEMDRAQVLRGQEQFGCLGAT